MQNITDAALIETINRELHREYRVLDGRPIYRLVWSDSQLEIRNGLFSEFYGHIFIRQVRQTKEVKKYWYLQSPCWMLEKLTFIVGQQALKEMELELVQSRNGTYEPIYSFQDGNFNPLPVTRTVVDLVLWQIHNPTKKVPSDMLDEMALEEKAEYDYFYDQLSQDERPELFIFDNSSFVSTKQLEFAKNYKKEYSEPSKPIELGETHVV